MRISCQRGHPSAQLHHRKMPCSPQLRDKNELNLVIPQTPEESKKEVMYKYQLLLLCLRSSPCWSLSTESDVILWLLSLWWTCPVTLLTFTDTPVWTLGSVERVMGPWDLKSAANLTQDALDPKLAHHRLVSEQSDRGGQKQVNYSNK